jgi:hypothetical protein
MNAVLVLENLQGLVVRTMPLMQQDDFHEGNEAQAKKFDEPYLHAIRRFDTHRIEMVYSLAEFDSDLIPYELIKTFSRADLKSQKPVALGANNFVRLASATTNTLQNTMLNLKTTDRKSYVWLTSLAGSALCGSLFLGFVLSQPKFDVQAQLQKVAEAPERVIKIIKRIPPKIAQFTDTKTVVTHSTVKPSTKVVNQNAVKRAGALGVLGSLKGAGKSRGVNLGAANTTAGPGLGGTGGSGGVQSSLYGKGILAAPLGGGGNIHGGGGYGTKGRGGGQAGYGTLSLAGSAGGAPIPLGREAIIQGGIDRDLVASVVERNIGQITFCYEQGLQTDPNLAGRIVAEWIITQNGTVQSPSVSSTTLESKLVEDCIMMRLKTWKFPLPQGSEGVKVAFPFVLKRRG